MNLLSALTARWRGKKLLFLSTGFVLLAFSCTWYIPGRHIVAWNEKAITATYVGAQFREISRESGTLFLAYSLQNHTDLDYRLANGRSVVLMSRLKPSGAVSSQQEIRLSYPTFLPARQKARIALEVTYLFGRPAENDPFSQDRQYKLRELFERLMSVQSFVLFDQDDRLQIEFPDAWRELTVAEGSRLTGSLGLKTGRIVIDAGHGGQDTGTIGPRGLIEKDLCLDIALRLGKLIQDKVPSAKVIYTRQNDTFVTLEQRTEIANKAKADLFLSIHANSSNDAKVGGIETYYMSSDTVPQAMDVAEANTLPHRPIQDLRDLLKEVARSRDLASDIQESLAAFVRDGSRPKRNRGVRKAPLVVLTGADMPSVLAEISFLSNPADEQWLMRPDNRQRVAEGLYRGIEKYLLNISSISTQLRPSRQTDSQP